MVKQKNVSKVIPTKCTLLGRGGGGILNISSYEMTTFCYCFSVSWNGKQKYKCIGIYNVYMFTCVMYWSHLLINITGQTQDCK